MKVWGFLFHLLLQKGKTTLRQTTETPLRQRGKRVLRQKGFIGFSVLWPTGKRSLPIG